MVKFLACAGLLLVGLTGCAGAGAPEPEPEDVADKIRSSRFHWDATQVPPPRFTEEFWTVELASLTADEMRVYLTAGLAKNELDHVGFDQVTIAECVDRVVAAALDHRARGDQPTRTKLLNAIDLYFAAKQEAFVRRTAGAASCIPGPR